MKVGNFIAFATSVYVQGKPLVPSVQMSEDVDDPRLQTKLLFSECGNGARLTQTISPTMRQRVYRCLPYVAKLYNRRAYVVWGPPTARANPVSDGTSLALGAIGLAGLALIIYGLMKPV